MNTNEQIAREAITIDGKDLYLGVFETVAEASEAYRQSAVKHFGDFACV